MADLNPVTAAQIERAFKTHDVDEAQINDAAEVRAACKQAATILASKAQPSRELSLALTALEDASMWATKAIAQRPPR